MKKKVVWLPYDMDTAIGINNEGALVFSYNLEDTDQLDGSDVFNGQQSVFWNNLRKTFSSELKQMYISLRDNKPNQPTQFSYEAIEKRFEEHQEKWPEAVFNEDAYFKYLQPYIDDGTSIYLSMLQGSKAEQRKWWLYNRFRYLDSKYNTGDAKSDTIVLRGYAKSTITVTPYADIYAAIKYGSVVLQQRAERNHSYDFPCPLDNVNDTETAIFSASQIASIGDLSGYQVGQCDIAKAIKLQELKVGDADPNYSNPHLLDLTFGNNTLLKKVGCRNCIGLGTTDPVKFSTPAPDMSGCTGLEEAYFEGTQITGIQFSNGGVLRVVHLPATVVSLQIFNQPKITDLSIPSYSQLRNGALVNTGDLINEVQLIRQLTNGTYVRFVGFHWTLANVTELQTLKAKLDMLGGLDETGNFTMDMAQLQGNIYIPTLTGAAVAEFRASYPSVTFTYDHITAELKYYSWDGQTLLHTETVTDGGNGTYTGTPSRTQTAQYTFAFSGWSTEMDSGTADANALKNVESDRNVYAAYTKTVRTYTVRFMNGTTVLQTVNNVPYGGTATYTGSTPVHSDPDNYEFKGWDPSPVGITGATDCQVTWTYVGSITRSLLQKKITAVDNSEIAKVGPYVFENCLYLTNVNLPAATHIGSNAFTSCKSLTSVNLPVATTIGNSAFVRCSSLTSINLPAATSIEASAFMYCINLRSVSLPVATSIPMSMFYNCYNLTVVNLPAATRVETAAFGICSSLTSINLPVATTIGNSAFVNCSALVDVSLPMATSIAIATFNSCSSLAFISLPKLAFIGQQAFNNCVSLENLVLLSTSVCALSGSNAFNNTPMVLSSHLGYFGSIYVPSSLVSAYKSATNWTYFADRITAYTGE